MGQLLHTQTVYAKCPTIFQNFRHEFIETDGDIPSEEILGDMLGDAIGQDSPMTEAAIAAGSKIMQARIDNAKAWLHWKPGDPKLDPATHDTQAIDALILSMLNNTA